MEYNTKFTRLLTSTLFLTSLGLSSTQSLANQDDAEKEVSKTVSASTSESKDSTQDSKKEYDKQFERARHFHEVKFNEDKSSYLLVPNKSTDEDAEETFIEITEDDIFYIKHGSEDLNQKHRNKRKKYSRHNHDSEYDEDEDDRHCWSFGKNKCNKRDGFHYAFSFVSSSGDDFYDPSGEATDLNTYASYRIQLASFFVETPGMATRRIHGLYAGRAWGFNFYNSDQWRLDLYKQRDTRGIRDLEGIQVRNKHSRAGVRLTGFFDSSLLQVNVSPYSTSDQKDDGVAASLSYSHFWQVKNWSLYGSAGVQFQPKEVVNFYEEQPTSFDNRSDRINHDVEVGFEYPLSKKWVFGGFASYSQSNTTVPGSEVFNDMADGEKASGFRSGLLLSFVL